MNEQLAKLILDYQASVSTAIRLMQESGIPLPATNFEWSMTAIPTRGELQDGIAYLKHGYGCAVELPDGPVDFDFGQRGEIDGFDAMRLALFAGAKLREYGFESEASLMKCFDDEVAAGTLRYSGHILHYVSDSN